MSQVLSHGSVIEDSHSIIRRAAVRTSWVWIAVGFAWAACAPFPVRAHGPYHVQILQLTEEIEKDPANSQLYMRRADLHRLHQNFDLAFADLERVRSMNATEPVLDLAMGRLYLDAGLPQSAVVAADRFLRAFPQHAEAHLLRARSLIQLEQPLEAADSYARSIQFTVQPGPELFIEQARAYAAAGTNHLESALQTLDRGITALGPLVTLEIVAIDMEMDRRAFDRALERLDRIAAQSPRKESWLKRRGDILEEAGRPEEARLAREQALQALQRLPPARRNVPAMQELEKDLRRSLHPEPAHDPTSNPPQTPIPGP